MVQMTKDTKDQEETEACCAGLSQLLSPQLFKALSDPKRLELLVRVAEGGGPSTVSSVAKGSGVDMSVVSRHLAILREAGVIKCEKQGKEVLCTLQTDVVVCFLRRLADALESCCPTKTAQNGPIDQGSTLARSNRSSRKQK
jgi:ArsR family transcriptional regulator, arsenate/arsenite/antimonite-responsive transcriptional repressor